MKREYYLAIDIGASSGRHIVGYEDENEIKTIAGSRHHRVFARVLPAPSIIMC